MLNELGRRLVDALAADCSTVRRQMRLPPGYSREVIETLLAELLVNVTQLTAYEEAMLARFELVPADSLGFTGVEQQELASRDRVLPARQFLDGGLPALSEADLYVLLVSPTESRRVHELLADARANGELSAHWAGVVGRFDPAAVEFTEQFEVLK